MKFSFEPDDIDILQGIVEESTEHLNGIEEGILKLETDFQADLLDSIFRAMHSVKGVASFVDFVPIRETAHVLESFLTDMKKGLYEAGAEITDLLLRGVDIINLLIRELAKHVQELLDNPPKETFEISMEDFGFKLFVEEVENLRSMLTNSLISSPIGPAAAELQGKPAPPNASATRITLEISPLLEQMMQEFIAETGEHLETIEQNCVAMERSANPEIINTIMRSFHSIKGGAGVISSMQEEEIPNNPILAIKDLTHASESLMQLHSKQAVKSSGKLIDLILEVVDKVSALIRMVQEEHYEDPGAEGLLEQINLMLSDTKKGIAKEESSSFTDRKLPHQFAAFMNITNQAMESMMSILNHSKENKLINNKAAKQYLRALKNISSSAKYLDYEVLSREVDKSCEYLKRVAPGKDVLDQELLEYLQQDFQKIKCLLELKVESIQTSLTEIPDDYGEKKIGEILVAENKVKPEDIELALSKQKKLGDILVDEGLIKKLDRDIILAKQSLAREKSQQMDQVKTAAAEPASQSIRVSQEKMDRLMNMIGELLITKNTVFHLAGKISRDYDLPALSREVKGVAGDLGRISNELQDAIMSARMIPLKVLFQRYPRTIRDTAKKTGKMVDLIIEGEETELDKTVIEAINDPLVHMLRNAVDHAIELPDARQMMGKNSTGTIRLKAFYQGSHAVIEISDDGKGLNPDEIKVKALQKGLIKADQIESMSNEEAFQLIFAPGFSTREAVSELSGRGVGMDVVKTNIEGVGGTVGMSSKLNEGTTFTLRIPLSMSIIKGLMVECRQQCFILPLDSIVETVKIQNQTIRHYRNTMVADIREEILPLLALTNILQIGPEAAEPVSKPDELVPVVVINVDGIKYGLIVERFQKEQEFVVKALAEELALIKIYSGATIMGDGSVVLILNPIQLLHAHLTAENGRN